MIHKAFRHIVRPLRYSISNPKQEDNDLVYGVNPVEAALHAGRRKLHKLYLSDSEHIELSSKTANLMKFTKEKEVPVVFTHKDKLSRMVKQQPHQNIVLECSPLPLTPWTP